MLLIQSKNLSNAELINLSQFIGIHSLKTPEQVKDDFLTKGITISQWARKHNYTPRDVSMVLNGQIKGRYGRGHEIAVALGIKPDHSEQSAA